MAVTYATVADVQARMLWPLSENEQRVCSSLLEDAAVLIDAAAPEADLNAKRIVSCRMIVRTLGSGDAGVPVGATQGSQSALGYTQSWTMGSGGAAAEIYLSRIDKRYLGVGNQLGSRSPVEQLAPPPPFAPPPPPETEAAP